MKKSFILIFILLIVGCFEVEAFDGNAYFTCEYTAYANSFPSFDGERIKIILENGDPAFKSIDGSPFSSYIWGMNNNIKDSFKSGDCLQTLYYACGNGTNNTVVCNIGKKASTASNSQFVGALNLTNKYYSNAAGDNVSGVGGSTNNGNGSGKNPLDFDFNGILGTEECPAIFGNVDEEGTIMYMLKNYFFTPVRILTPIILILLTTLDFAKAVFADEKDGMKKAQGNFVKRAVAALIIFLAPTIVSTLLSLADYIQTNDCAKDTNNDVFENL